MLRLSSRFVLRKHQCSTDQISLLPDEILILILSLLTLKEAASTSILCRRWKYLWTFSRSLDFDADTTLFALQTEKSQNKLDEMLAIEIAKYVGWVNQVLKRHRANEIDQFRICFDLYTCSPPQLDRWVNYAIQKRVQVLELDLTDYCGIGRDVLYTFPSLERLLSSSNAPLSSAPFSHLTSLCLRHLNVTEDFLQYILANCPLLEQLCVQGSSCLANLTIAGPSLKLKYLELSECEPLRNLEISAVNLVSFTYIGPKEKVPFKDVPLLLSELSIGGEYCYSFIFKSRRHLSYLSRLEKLKLIIPPTVNMFAERRFPLKFPTLHNLKHLEVHMVLIEEDSLYCYTSLIMASPLLSKFVMKMRFIKPRFPKEIPLTDQVKRQRDVTKRSHRCLKEIELAGFVGVETDIEFILHLLDIVVSLEKITIDTRFQKFARIPQKFGLPGDDKAAKVCAQLLGNELPPGVELVIL